NDEEEKPEIYAAMGVREYFQYDPTGDYLTPPLKGRRKGRSGYKIIIPDRLGDGTIVLRSVVLGLEMRLLPDGQLRFFDPERVEYLRTHSEERERGDREKERADREKERADREKERAEQLAAKLLELGIDPNLLN
ncbi:MAG: Uma2 family endonuclease, partial [Hormoscilla sp.]